MDWSNLILPEPEIEFHAWKGKLILSKYISPYKLGSSPVGLEESRNNTRANLSIAGADLRCLVRNIC